jgi:signal peptidase I
VSDSPESADAADQADPVADEPEARPPKKKRPFWVELPILIVIAFGLTFLIQTFIAKVYYVPSGSMEQTLHGVSSGGDRILANKVVYDFGDPQPGDVIVFKGPPNWNIGYKSIRSDNAPVRWVQNALSFIGFVPPDENDLVKRVIAVGGQTVECRANTGLTVDGKRLDEPYLDYTTMNVEPTNPYAACLGNEFGPVKVPEDKVWVMGDNRTHSADSRFHCTNTPADAQRGVMCTGDPEAGTVPIANVIGKAQFIAWPPGRWGGVDSVNPQTQ